MPTSTPPEWTGDAGAGSAGSATTEARGGRWERGRGDARRRRGRARGWQGWVGRSLRRLLSASSQRPRGEKLRNPAEREPADAPVSRFIVGSRSAVLRSCADSFRGRDEERSRTIGRRRRAPSLRPLSPPSTSARPPPPKPPSSRRARPRRLHRQSVFFLPPSALRLASFRSIACAASTRPTGTSSTDINTYGLFSSVRRPSSASRSGARTSLVACARKRGRSAGSRQFTRPGGRRRLRPRTPRDPKGGGSRIARRRTSYSRSNSFSNIPRDARVRRDGPPDARRGTRAVECDPRSESRDDGRDA